MATRVSLDEEQRSWLEVAGMARVKIPIFIVLAWLLSLGAVPAYAQPPPPMPHSFYGTVTINGEAAPVGALVTAKVGGVECGRYTVKVAGRYGNRPTADYLAVTGSNLHAGDTINFYINGVATTQTASFEPGGGPTELNLSVTTATTPVTPSVATNVAASVTTASATLAGSLSSLGSASSVTVSFQWGTTTSYGHETTPETMTSTGQFSATISGLAPATTYHYRAKVVAQSTSYGADRSFVTLGSTGGGGGQISPTGKTGTEGVTTQPVTIKSEDGLSRLTIAQDVNVLDKAGNPLSQVSINPVAEPPPLPERTSIVGRAYDLKPDGALPLTPR